MYSFSSGFFLFSFLCCWNSRFKILVVMTFLLRESWCYIFFLICSQSPGGFPHSQSVGSKASLKTSTLPASSSSSLLLWLLSNSNTCFVLIHAKQISDLNRFRRGYFSTNSDGDSFVFLFAQQESPGLIKTWRLKKKKRFNLGLDWEGLEEDQLLQSWGSRAFA